MVQKAPRTALETVKSNGIRQETARKRYKQMLWSKKQPRPVAKKSKLVGRGSTLNVNQSQSLDQLITEADQPGVQNLTINKRTPKQ